MKIKSLHLLKTQKFCIQAVLWDIEYFPQGDGDGDGDGDDSIVAHLSVCLCVPDLCVRGLLSIVNVWWSALFF